MLVNGAWTEIQGSKSFAVINPATGEVIEHVADGGQARRFGQRLR